MNTRTRSNFQKMAQGGPASSTIKGLIASETWNKSTTGLKAIMVPLFLAGPPMVGLFTGSLHSALSSPTKQDEEAVEQAIELAELEEQNAEIKRLKAHRSISDALREKLNKQPKGKSERSLHI